MTKLRLASALFIAPSLWFASQTEPEKWSRVYTGSESIIEIDRSSVTFTANNVNHQVDFRTAHTGRVRFRTTFSKPQPLDKNPAASYKTSLETYEFRCQKDSRVIQSAGQLPPLKATDYRSYTTSFLSSDDKVIGHHDGPGDWKPIRSGYVMDKLGEAACTLIEEKRRTP